MERTLRMSNFKMAKKTTEAKMSAFKGEAVGVTQILYHNGDDA
jgi:hypothetical protein